MQNYYEKLRDLRIDNDKSQAEIAELLGITRQQYSLYELGKREFKIEHIERLCNYYGVSADYILNLSKGLKYPER